MSINLRKPAKVNLTKGQRVVLTKTTEKDGEPIEFGFAGANWSCLENGQSVDLDLSFLMYDENKKLLGAVYYRDLVSRDGAIRHSGDDRVGDEDGDDGMDNEIISVKFSKLDPRTAYMVSILNNYTHQSFGDIPNIELRIYTNDSGKAGDVENVLASYKLDNNQEFEKFQAIVLGHFYKHKDQWKFSADGIGSAERSIDEIAKGSALSVLD